MWRNLRLRPILASVLVLALARGALAADLDTGDSYYSPYNYAGNVTFTVTNYEEAAVANFPVYIRISETLIPGFRYSDLKNGLDDVVFLDTLGKALPYEIETWNTGGESRLWLKLSSLREGEKFTMCWNLRNGCAKPEPNVAQDVWGEYVGVWHMDETIDEVGAQAQRQSKDSTANGNNLIPRIGPEGVYRTQTSASGVFGNARVNDTSARNKKQGSYFEISNSSNMVFNGVCTLSFWINFDAYANYPQLAGRRSGSTGYAGFQIDMAQGDGDLPADEKAAGTNPRQCLIARGDTQTGSYHKIVDKPFKEMGFVHLVFVYNGTKVSIYSDGVCRVDGMTIGQASDNGNPIAIGNQNGGTSQSVWGKYDEIRLYKGVKSAEWIAAEHATGTNTHLWAYAVTVDNDAVLKNGWVSEPSITKTTWEDGTYPTEADFTLGTPSHGTAVIAYYDKTTGLELDRVPKKVGEYRAVITVAESEDASRTKWGALKQTIDFRIISNSGQIDFTPSLGRILLMNDDYSVDGGEVYSQGYDDEDETGGNPYWRHLDADGNDASTAYDEYWSDSPAFNLGGGTHHVYSLRGKTLWDLANVRVGNTFNNGEDLDDRGLPPEKNEQGLSPDQNYLPWSAESQRVLTGDGDPVGPYHRYAGQIVMQNTLGAQVTSAMFTNGVGTVYFDAVNGWTDNVYGADGAANYRLVVEIATTTDYSSAPPRDELVNSVVSNNLYDAEGNCTGRVAVVRSYAEYANWRQVPVRVLYFDGDACEDLGMQDSLVLDVENGGSYRRFYRAIAPVNLRGNVRVRIRRAAIDPDQSLSPDGTAYILMDNVICSMPADCVNLSPYGRYDPSKKGKQVLGCEAAFTPAFPSAGEGVTGRAKATMANGGPVTSTRISSATMHYRWHYVDQMTTPWQLADLDPATLTTHGPLDVPRTEGDIEFWFDLNQTGNYYEYADYSGTGLGLGGCGYNDAITSVTNRAPTYSEATGSGNWFVRVREGRSNFAEMKLLVKTAADGPVTEHDLYVTPDNLWSGYYRMTQPLAGGLWWRIEPRDRQEDGATAWQSTTNRWFVAEWAETAPTYPAAGRMREGTTNSWSRAICDAQTGYLQFQVDETTYGVTVIHADYQNFNDWNDAARGYFTGSSSETNMMRGTSANVRTYALDYASWADTPATDDNWSLKFIGKVGDKDHPGYQTFLRKDKYFSAWDLGKGMWVYGSYRDTDSPVAYQMAGSGEGYAEFVDKTILGDDWPRGYESVSFHARIAQPISPEWMSYVEDSSRLTNYTFMARTCFDMKQNKGFTGNAALSLFAYFRNKKGAYEARWEQIDGELETTEPYKGLPLEPTGNGQRLIISRWKWTGNSYEETELVACTNSGKWKVDMPLMPYVDGESMTNNLMPFCISAYQLEKNGPTYITAAVRIDKSAGKRSGVTADTDSIGGTSDQKWYFVTFKDESADRLTSGAYGVLSSNCEGMFVRPQYRAQLTWPGNLATPQEVKKEVVADPVVARTKAALPAFEDCREDLEDDFWSLNDGRNWPYFGKGHDFGIMYVEPYQTVDVYTKSLAKESAEWTLIKQVPLTGFGAPGRQPDEQPYFYYTADSAIRLQAGGGYDDPRIDIVISDIVQRQWRGLNSDVDQETKLPMPVSYCHTNFIFTTGWVTNGATQLSAKRTEVGTPCSIRSPLLDGDYHVGTGLGMFGFSYREPQKNVRLFVQIATNVTGTAQMDSLTMNPNEGESKDANGSWLTVADLTYENLWTDIARTNPDGTKSWEIAFGYHGANGMMRVIVDPALVEELSDAGRTDPTQFGAIDITSVVCQDEPALDKGCWWGWNMQTGGDATDSQHRMFLSDFTGGVPHGRWLALNNSVTDGTDPAERVENYDEHMPFVQSPTFTNSLIGQVTFKARKYDISDRSPDAKIVIYGTDKKPDAVPKDSDWTYITDFDITNTLYTTYTFKTDSAKFCALRLAVVDVPGAKNPPDEPPPGDPAQRVLIDEVTVSEAVRAMLAFRNVGAFRHHLEVDDNTEVPGVTTRVEQPLCGENWGVQAEVFATMLGDEIDKSFEPIVRLHWYVGKDRWGYDSWKGVAPDNKKRGNAQLAQTVESNYVYRASYPAAPDAIMAAQNVPGTVVQYMLEVEYQTVNTSKGVTTYPRATNWLDTAAWTAPEWFAPVDYNADPAVNPKGNFAAFTILDNVAPGWAWINEANVFGTKTSSGGNSDKEFQYVEIIAPMEADLSGWRVRLLEAGVYNDTVTTNWVAKFGNGAWTQLPGLKRGNVGAAERKVFHSIGNKESALLDKSNGTLDGVWQFSALTSMFRESDGMYYVSDIEMPFGVQLVRPTGVIESSIVTVGTNRWGRLPGYRDYDPTNIVAKLNKNVPGSRFFYAGEDCCGTFRSVGVTEGQGETPSVWANDWACSPGRINTNFTGQVQIIEPEHPMPLGDAVIVYASVDTSFGHISQRIGGPGSSLTNATEMIILRKGNAHGTNIVYTVDPWYELEYVKTNGVNQWKYEKHTRQYEAKGIGKNASNNVEVVARAKVDSSLADYLKDGDPYNPAILDWLAGGETLKWGAFANNGEIVLADYVDKTGTVVTNLTLKTMYWLDMDPTISNQIFQAYIADPPTPHVDWPIAYHEDGTPYRGSSAVTNIRMSVYMMISNETHGTWAPYVLRGVEPRSLSWDYDPKSSGNWTSETFKVTGILANGLTYEDNDEYWIPIRWFVFDENSFKDDFTTDIEVRDPHVVTPIGAEAWYQWFNDPAHPEHAKTPVFYRWAIDERMKPVEVEVLQKENFY